MKAIICEMCGSQDLVKQNSLYVCQNCGTKYSVEEARNLLSEVPEVTINYSKELQNLYEVARRARDNENHENAALYYEQIMAKDPKSWEAAFYSVYSRSLACKVGEIPVAASNVANCLDAVMGLIHDNVSDAEEQERNVKEVADKAENAAKLFMGASCNAHQNISSEYQAQYVPEFSNRGFAAISVDQKLGYAIKNVFADDIWAYPLAMQAFETANDLVRNFIFALKPSSLWNTAPIHKTMENKATDEMGKNRSQYNELLAAKNQLEQKKLKEYWNSHKEEKEQLDNELLSLESDKTDIETEIQKLLEKKEQVPAKAEFDDLNLRIEQLVQRKNALSLFKGKQKKELQEQIDLLEKEKDAIQERLNEQQDKVESEIHPLRIRCSSIENRMNAIQGKLQDPSKPL